jgi:hypothetical protein
MISPVFSEWSEAESAGEATKSQNIAVEEAALSWRGGREGLPVKVIGL